MPLEAPSTDTATRQVDENMHRAHRRDAVNQQKFYFRKDIMTKQSGSLLSRLKAMSAPATPAPSSPTMTSGHRTPNGVNGVNGNGTPHEPSIKQEFVGPCCAEVDAELAKAAAQTPTGPVEDEYEEMTINEIINGKGDRFRGLMGVVELYLDAVSLDPEMRARFDRLLELIKRRADGSLVTTATWIRTFIREHPAYKHDSVINEEINYDLMKALDEIERGQRAVPELLPAGYQPWTEDADEAFAEYCGTANKVGVQKIL